MLKITAKAVVKIENQSEFLEVSKVLIEETRKEEGNISYGVFREIQNHEILTFLEEWETVEAIDIHGKSDHFQAAIGKLQELSESFEINVYTQEI